MSNLIETFDAVDDSGNVYEILVYQKTIVTRDRSGVSHIPGMTYFVTSTGDTVSPVLSDDGNWDGESFDIIQTGHRVRKLRKGD